VAASVGLCLLTVLTLGFLLESARAQFESNEVGELAILQSARALFESNQVGPSQFNY
jgi:hypothetical protein